MRGRPNLDLRRARFASQYEPELNTGCWLWAGAVRDGYGVVRLDGRLIGAHRAAFMWFVGSIPDVWSDGLRAVVRHRCDTPLCVNPAHLKLGSHRDNVGDRIARSRTRTRGRPGSENHNAKLSEDKVRLILGRLAAGESQRTIASDFGVKQQAIAKISTGKRWRHVSRNTFRRRG